MKSIGFALIALAATGLMACDGGGGDDAGTMDSATPGVDAGPGFDGGPDFDAGGDDDAGPPAGALGAACERNSDCDSSVCLPVSMEENVCSSACAAASECPAGWTCDAIGGIEGDVCQCDRMPEACNMLDDDCDGTVDEGAGEDVGCTVPTETCEAGACVCPSEDMCGGGCVDRQSDTAHCGACDTPCASACFGGECVGIVHMSAISNSTCAVFSNGRIMCWGFNAMGSEAPRFLEGIDDAVQVASFRVLHSDGTLTRGFGPPTLVLSDVAGFDSAIYSAHACAWQRDGTPLCWGDNMSGQIGNGTTDRVADPLAVAGLTDIAGMVAGTGTSCAWRNTTGIYCWGRNTSGQVGDGTMTNRLSPPATPLFEPRRVLGAAVSNNRVCFWTSTISRCMGDNGFSNDLTPTPVTGLGNPVAGAGGINFMCLVLDDGTLQCMGQGTTGQLGDGMQRTSHSPVTVTGISNAVGVTAGMNHTCAWFDDGNAACWGDNRAGQVDGVPADEFVLSPQAVRF